MIAKVLLATTLSSTYAYRIRSPSVRMDATVAATSIEGLDGKVAPVRSWDNAPDRTSKTDKEKVVVLGSGWAAVKFVQNIDTSKMDVTVISPRNFFLFTPFLPSVTVGTVESRTVVESMRKLVQYESRPIDRKIKDSLFTDMNADNFETARYFESACDRIDPANNKIYCHDASTSSEQFTISYDKLIIAVGGAVDTFGTPGVKEHAVFLKEVEDAMSIRKKVLDAFEGAALVDDPEEKARRAAFVVVGAGPTGLEFAAELSDSIREDFAALFPEEVAAATVSLVSSSKELLATYDSRVSTFTQDLLAQSEVVLKTGKRVVEVKEDSVVIMDKASKEQYEIPSAVTLWSTGVAPIDLVKDFMTEIPEQTKRHGIYVDRNLRAFGTDNVYALGDCASVVSRGKDMLDSLKAAYDAKGAQCPEGSGKLVMSKQEAMSLMDDIAKQYKTSKSFTQAGLYQARITGILDRDLKDDKAVTCSDFQAALDDCYSGLRSLPPTAQVAGQQGSYLAKQFNGETDSEFKYFHKGSMAYIGQDKAAAQVSMLKSLLPEPLQGLPLVGEDIVITGSLAELVWKFLYLDMQISNRNKVQVAFDWLKTGIFGRDTSKC